MSISDIFCWSSNADISSEEIKENGLFENKNIVVYASRRHQRHHESKKVLTASESMVMLAKKVSQRYLYD